MSRSEHSADGDHATPEALSPSAAHALVADPEWVAVTRGQSGVPTTLSRRAGLTLTLGEAANLAGKCHVDEERARG
jgi:hypothetical protein